MPECIYTRQQPASLPCLQFQLTINFVALAVAAVAAVTNGETPLNVLQLLWVNLIMDAMAALGETRPTHRTPRLSSVLL